MALAGALLTDLARAGRLGVDDSGKRLRVLDASPTGDTLLDEGLRRFAEKDGKKLSSILAGVGEKIDRVVGDYLQAQGVVQVEEGSLLRATRYPTADPEPERALRARLAEVLGGTAPTTLEQAVLGLVQALGVTTSVFDADEVGLSRRELKHRVKKVAEAANPGAEAVDRAIQEAQTAVLSAIVASTVVTSVTS